MLVAESLTKQYGALTALRAVSFQARPGEVLGLLGPNGSGKSTTVKILTGLLRPSAGHVTLNGIDIFADLPKYKAKIGYVPEEPHLYSYLTGPERSMIASFALSLELPTQLLNDHVTRWRYKLPVDYWDKYPDRVSAVTKHQVTAAARTYLDAQRLQIVAVGDPTRVSDVLKKLGPVETFDADGKRVSSSF
jgi:ABC-type Na+ transport system ATPase subunit NatA